MADEKRRHTWSRMDPKYGRDLYRCADCHIMWNREVFNSTNLPACTPRPLSETIRLCIRDYGEGKDYITLHRVELDLLLEAYDVLYRQESPSGDGGGKR